MKKFIVIGVFVSLTLTLFSINTFAQSKDKTAYQKKVHELAEKYYCIVNHNTENPKNLNFTDQYTMAIFTGKVYDEESFNNFAGMLILTKVNVMSTSQMESLKKRMDNDLKAAAKGDEEKISRINAIQDFIKRLKYFDINTSNILWICLLQQGKQKQK